MNENEDQEFFENLKEEKEDVSCVLKLKTDIKQIKQMCNAFEATINKYYESSPLFKKELTNEFIIQLAKRFTIF